MQFHGMIFLGRGVAPHTMTQANDTARDNPLAGTAPLLRGCQPQRVELPGAVVARGFLRFGRQLIKRRTMKGEQEKSNFEIGIETDDDSEHTETKLYVIIRGREIINVDAPAWIASLILYIAAAIILGIGALGCVGFHQFAKLLIRGH